MMDATRWLRISAQVMGSGADGSTSTGGGWFPTPLPVGPDQLRSGVVAAALGAGAVTQRQSCLEVETAMRERIEQVGDILLAAAHEDHHIEAAEIDKIEEILRGIWRQEPSPDSLVRRVTEFREGDTIDAEEMARLGSVLRDLQPREELPAALVQRLADFDPARFDIDEAVAPFLHEPYEFKRKLLELAVTVHESDGELDFAEDTFIRELGYKLGLELHQFQDLLLEFIASDESKA